MVLNRWVFERVGGASSIARRWGLLDEVVWSGSLTMLSWVES
jgi:hypothetical protein